MSFRRVQKQQTSLDGVGQQLLGIFFSFKVQSLWSKVQRIYLFSKELPKCDQGLLWGHCPSVLLKGPRFRSVPQWAVMQLHRMCSACGNLRVYSGEQIWSLHCFFLLHYVGGQGTDVSICQLECVTWDSHHWCGITED